MLIKSTRQSAKVQAASTPAVGSDNSAVEEQNAPAPKDQLLSGDAGQRVGHFVRQVTMEGLQHLRYLSAADAFGKVGSTLGSVALTPLAISITNENPALIGGLGIGGTIAAGAVGAAIGYAWLHRKDGQDNKAERFANVSDTALAIGTALEALPKFVYPTVIGATDAQRDLVYDALDKLPLHQATASATVEVIPDLVDTGISGMAQPGSSHVHMLLDEGYVNRPSWGTPLMIHEQAHAVDYAGGFGLIGAHNWKGGFGKEPFVSNYASTNRYEDFAESFEAYHMDREDFVARFPEKAAAIEEISHPDALSAAVDREGVRETGKKIGDALGAVPYLRTGLELAGSLVAPIQMHRGASKLIDGLESGDDRKKLDGKLQLASGLFLSLPGARPLGLATSIAGAAIKATADENDHKHLEQANKWADGVLSASAGPVGMTVAAVAGELGANGLRMDDSQGFGPQGWQNALPGKGDMLKGTLSTVGGTVTGAILGASLGGALSGHGGAFVGALWGQAAGGIIGLTGYSVYKATKKGDPNDPLALTKSDKRFLKRMVGGAVVGGGVGTVAGAVGGRMAGKALGNAFFGPTGGSILGSLGGWVGGLGGAYGGAKLGAGVGSGRLLGKPFNPGDGSGDQPKWQENLPS